MPDANFTYLRFVVVGSSALTPWKPGVVYLKEDDWDDYFTYSTGYIVIYCNIDNTKTTIGQVKIGEFNMSAGQRRANIPKQFTQLGDEFFSLGQGSDYYEEINKLGESLRCNILASLNDVAANLNLWNEVEELDVTKVSLTRDVSATEIKGQLHRMTQGGVRLTDFNFSYIAPKREMKAAEEFRLNFLVKPESVPPSNIHVIIGRNGVGKTRTLNLMTKALVAKRSVAAQSGKFVDADEELPTEVFPFSNLVSVCFSAFDSFMLGPDDIDPETTIDFSCIGLRRVDEAGVLIPKSLDRLASEFVKSMEKCGSGARCHRWKRAIANLETDSIFESVKASSFIDGILDKERQTEIKKSSRN